ncbi:alpha/beta fold hydrolase [Streptomyces sp. NPDC055607]
MHPETAPYDQGLLDVGDGNLVHWEVSGNPEGKPALVVHGGPGSGSSPRSRRFFDPAAYRVVLLDQRGCGRSVPHASDPAADLSVNTTAHLVADMERLREHLGIEKWLLHGGSWGSTLILAYAEAHPERVTEIVIAAVTTTRRSETAWLYEGVGRFFPEAHERFRAGAGTTDGAGAEELVGAYAALIRDAHRLAGVLVHGRLDMGGPLTTARELVRAWPDAELHVVERAGHLGGEETGRPVLAALDRFARN